MVTYSAEPWALCLRIYLVGYRSLLVRQGRHYYGFRLHSGNRFCAILQSRWCGRRHITMGSCCSHCPADYTRAAGFCRQARSTALRLMLTATVVDAKADARISPRRVRSLPMQGSREMSFMWIMVGSISILGSTTPVMAKSSASVGRVWSQVEVGRLSGCMRYRRIAPDAMVFTSHSDGRGPVQ